MKVFEYIKGASAAIGAALGYFLGGVDGLLITLIVFVSVDYVTGVAAAFVQNRVSSEVGFKGLLKKVFIFCLVGVAAMLDHNILGNTNVLRSAVIFFYLANEGISIIENAAMLGLPIPAALRKSLEQLKTKSDENGDAIDDANDESED